MLLELSPKENKTSVDVAPLGLVASASLLHCDLKLQSWRPVWFSAEFLQPGLTVDLAARRCWVNVVVMKRSGLGHDWKLPCFEKMNNQQLLQHPFLNHETLEQVSLSNNWNTFHSLDLKWPISLNTVLPWCALGALCSCFSTVRHTQIPLHPLDFSPWSVAREIVTLVWEFQFGSYRGPLAQL